MGKKYIPLTTVVDDFTKTVASVDRSEFELWMPEPEASAFVKFARELSSWVKSQRDPKRQFECVLLMMYLSGRIAEFSVAQERSKQVVQ